jgi:hypothetical protein
MGNQNESVKVMSHGPMLEYRTCLLGQHEKTFLW